MEFTLYPIYGLAYLSYVILHVFIWSYQAKIEDMYFNSWNGFLFVLVTGTMLLTTVLSGFSVRQYLDNVDPERRHFDKNFKKLISLFLSLAVLDSIKNIILNPFSFFMAWGLFHTFLASFLIIIPLYYKVKRSLPYLLGLMLILKKIILDRFLIKEPISINLGTSFNKLNIHLLIYSLILLGSCTYFFMPYLKKRRFLACLWGLLVIGFLYKSSTYSTVNFFEFHYVINYFSQAFVLDVHRFHNYPMLLWFSPILGGFLIKDLFKLVKERGMLILEVGSGIFFVGYALFVNILTKGAHLDKYFQDSLGDPHHLLFPSEMALFIVLFGIFRRFHVRHLTFKQIVFAYIYNYFLWTFIGLSMTQFLSQYLPLNLLLIVSFILMMTISLLIAKIVFFLMTKRFEFRFVKT